MPGVKQFDREKVLDRAMTVFWERGYEATTIQDLLDAMGINRGSLYATFGDKKRLFLTVLDRYSESVGKPLMAELIDSDPHHAIERMFESIIRRNSDARWPRGCLNTNTALECPGSGDAISRKIAERLRQQESAIYRVLRRAQLQGMLDLAQNARALARFFMGTAQALNVVNKAAPDPSILRDMVSVAMGVWKTPPQVRNNRQLGSAPAHKQPPKNLKGRKKDTA